MKEIGLYIHIPFCHSICNYCDFPKRVSNDYYEELYFLKLLKELEYRRKTISKYKIKSIYIGGGTPSSVKNHHLVDLLECLNSFKDNFNDDLEFSIEANPEDITEEFIKTIVKYRVNRLSIGVQSFNKEVLKVINRVCNYEDLKEKLEICRKNGLKNINLDYMYGILPIEINDIKKDLDLFISLNPKHLSCYSLILEEHTVLYHEFKKGTYKETSPDLEADTYYFIVSYLKNQGYHQYEISNFAIENYECLHNKIYWSNEEYLSFGLAASSYLENYRFKNTTNFKEYLELDFNNSKFIKDIEKLDLEDQEIYEIITNLRKVEGIDLIKFKNLYHIDFYQKHIINNNLEEELIKNKICLIENNHFKINPHYFYISNTIINKILG